MSHFDPFEEVNSFARQLAARMDAYGAEMDRVADAIAAKLRVFDWLGRPRSSPSKPDPPEPSKPPEPPPVVRAVRIDLPTKKTHRKRNQGMIERCKGVYLTAIGRDETPPRVSEIARIVGCHKGTASRAIGPLEATRKELAKSDARRRYRDSD